MVRLALDLAASRVVDWGTVPVLVVGTGRYAATTIAALPSIVVFLLAQRYFIKGIAVSGVSK